MLRRPDISTSRSAALLGAATLLVLSLTACGPSADPPVGPTASAPAPAPSPTDTAPVFVPEGTADDNLPVLTAVTAQVWASDTRGSGRAYVDALVAAGFDKSAMQVTQDRTTVGNPVESLQFSVRWGDSDCLVGQVGPSTGDPVTAVLPQLAEGRCLVGATRAIDW